MQFKGLKGKVPVPLKSFDAVTKSKSKQKQSYQKQLNILKSKDLSDWSKPSQISPSPFLLKPQPPIQSLTQQSQSRTQVPLAHQLEPYGSMSMEELSEQLHSMRLQLLKMNRGISPRLNRYTIGSPTQHKLTTAEINSTSQPQLLKQITVNKAILQSNQNEIHQIKLLMSNLDSKDYLSELLQQIQTTEKIIRVGKMEKQHQETNLQRLDLLQLPSFANIKALKQEISVLKKKEKEQMSRQEGLNKELEIVNKKYQDIKIIFKNKQKEYREENIDNKIKQEALMRQMERIKSNTEACLKNKRSHIEQLQKEVNQIKRQCLQMDFKVNQLRQKQNNTEIQIQRILPRIAVSTERRNKIPKQFQIIEIGQRIVKIGKNSDSKANRKSQQVQSRNWRSISIDAS